MASKKAEQLINWIENRSKKFLKDSPKRAKKARLKAEKAGIDFFKEREMLFGLRDLRR